MKFFKNAGPLRSVRSWGVLGLLLALVLVVGYGQVESQMQQTGPTTGRFECPHTAGTHVEFLGLFGCHGAAIRLNEFRGRNRLLISAYDSTFGNFIYSENPDARAGQGFGIAGGTRMAPFPRFVVNANETFLGYSILPGNGMPATGGDGTGNLYVRGSVGIGTTAPGGYKLNVQGGTGNAIYGEIAGGPTMPSAVYGLNTANGYAIRGLCTFVGCRPVYGENLASGVGVHGKGGVNGEGVRGETSGPDGKAVRGINPAGYGGYFEGKLAVRGLPTSPPPGETTVGMLCITNAGNIWIDTTPDTPCVP